MVASTLYFEEGLRTDTESKITCIMDVFGIRVVRVDVHDCLVKPVVWMAENRCSPSRAFDVAYMMMARDHGCKHIVAIDGFMVRGCSTFFVRRIRGRLYVYEYVDGREKYAGSFDGIVLHYPANEARIKVIGKITPRELRLLAKYIGMELDNNN